ncbi:DUF4397 domain-containing protein [candidate division GN15 bacterium]|nr:DUF4397 domain-containing protein [candidate division GN15 bacterium]
MTRLRLTSLVLLFSIMSIFVIGCDDDDNDPVSSNPALTTVRVIHASYDAPAVDVRVDGSVAVPNLGFGSSSGYATINAGSRSITVVPTGASSPVVINETLTLAEGAEYTVFAIDELSSISALAVADDRAPVSGQAKVRFVHASPDAPAVDIKLNDGNGAAVFANTAFGEAKDYTTVAGGSYTFAVTAAGQTDEVVTFQPVTLQNGTVYTIVAKGTLDENDSYPFFVRVFVDNGAGNTFVDLVPAPVPMANVRVIHTSYDAPNVDVQVDGTGALSNLAYGAASDYTMVEAGTRNVTVTETGTTTPAFIDANLPLTANTDYTVFAVGAAASIEAIFDTDVRTPDPSMAKLRFVHASPDAPAVDIKLNDGNGAAVFANADFKDITDYTSVSSGSYTFAVTATGDTNAVVIFEPVAVQAGVVYTVVAHGTLDATDAYPFAVRVFVDNDPGSNFVDLTAETSDVMVVHASPDAPAVDLMVDGATAGSGLTFPNNTGYLGVASGTRNVKVAASVDPMNPVIDANVSFSPDLSYSVFAIDSLASIEPLVLADDLSAPASGFAHVRFIHLSPNAPAVDIGVTGGGVVFDSVAFRGVIDFTPLAAGTYDLEVRLEGTSTVVLPLPGIEFVDGRIYTVFARGFNGGSGDQALNATIITNQQ